MAIIAAVAMANSAFAAVFPVTNAVIWGSGNSNGGFTVDQSNGIELGIRAKTRYPVPNDSPAGIMADGNGNYGSFPTGNFGPGGVRGSWNVDWSINSDYANGATPLDTFTYQIQLDYDPFLSTNFLNIDPLNFAPSFDHGFGDNTNLDNTGTIAGSVAGAQLLAQSKNLMQNSWNLAFFSGPQAFSPLMDGVYTIVINAFRPGTTDAIASASIDVIVGTGIATPEPFALITWAGLIGCAAVASRRKQR